MLTVQIIGAAIAFVGTLVSGLIADRFGRRTTLAAMAVLIGIFSLAAPWLLDGGVAGQDISSWSASVCWGCPMARRPAW